MSDQGFIVLHRKVTEWEWYDHLPTKAVFFHLLITANWEPRRFQGHDIPRGSVVVGRRQLAEDVGVSEKQARSALERLEKSGEVAIKRTNKFSIISITNYCKYQDKIQPRAIKGPTKGHQRANEGPQLNKETINKGTKEKTKPNGLAKNPTPRDELEIVLDRDRAEAVIDHRQRIRKPLTARAAKLLAGKFAKCDDPNAAADEMIANGWQGFDPSWLKSQTDTRINGHGKRTHQANGPEKRTLADWLSGGIGQAADDNQVADGFSGTTIDARASFRDG